MSEPFLAEIRIIGFNFAPRGWAFCDGQILPISQNQSLYSLLGTTYGGDGRTSFALPDLRSRVPIHRSDSHQLGSHAGSELVILDEGSMPTHNHQPLQGTNVDGSSQAPAGNLLARSVSLSYQASAPSVSPGIQNNTVSHVGSGLGHENRSPYITLGFAIALRGLFPSRN